ncbi:MAG TPA: 5'-nucleotidase C-terminal domain-containing protein [Woeseiaceae bacterium]
MRILLILTLLLAACAATPESTAPGPSGLTFVHLNDTYRVGAVEDGTKGGFGRVVTLIRDLQDKGRDVRILHGGDFLYPSLESQLWQGMQMVEAMNYLDDLAPLYVTTGNHEFDPRTPDHLVNAVRASTFDWLGDNYEFMTGDDEVDAALKQRFIFEHKGRRIGIFALTAHPDDGGSDRDYVPIEKDYLGAARKAMAEFEAAGVDAIIGVTHLYMATDVELAGLKKDYPRLAFIVGGHDHEPQYSKGSGSTAPVMKGASNARAIWTIELDFDAEGLPVVDERFLEMGAEVGPDEDYAAIDRKWHDKLYEIFPFLAAQVGEVAVPLDATEERIRSTENGWGNFIVDQMRTAFGDAPADLAFINSGTLRIDDIVVGDITFEDIARTFAFSSYLRYMTVSGREFRKLMETGYRGSGSQGYFPQVSGFRVCVDRSLPDGERIVSLQVPDEDGWQEIGTDTEYTLVVPDFLYRGGDGYVLSQDRPASRPGSELKYLVLDAIVKAQAAGEAVGALPDPANPRYVALGPERRECWD